MLAASSSCRRSASRPAVARGPASTSPRLPRRPPRRRDACPASGSRRRCRAQPPPLAACSSVARSRPCSRSHARSTTVAFVPGSTARSGRPNSAASRTQRTRTPGSRASGSKSSKLAMRGRRITATSTSGRSPASSTRSGRSRATASSSATPMLSIHGITPSTGTPVRCSISSMAGPSSEGSPRKRLITNPRTSARSSGGSSSSVPSRCAKPARRFGSAGLPAPSATTRS